MKKYIVKIKRRLPTSKHFLHISVIEVDELIELNNIEGLADFKILEKVKKRRA